MPTLTGLYQYGEGTPRVGSLRFAPSVTIVGDDTIILPAPVVVPLVDGAVSVVLVATDDPAYAPLGWVWEVEERMTGGRTWAFELTEDADLSELAATTPPGDYELLVPTSRAITAGDGLVGGGTLAADRTVAVGAGFGVTVAADEVAVDPDVIATVAYADGVGAASDGTAAAALSGHNSDTTGVHGIADTAALVTTDDPRLSDARTPTAHKTTHAIGGTDALTATDVGAAPALGSDDNYVTDAEKTKLANLSGVNTGDQALPTWSTIAGKPAVVAEGATQTAARAAIGAGTSSLVLGTTAGTAAEGNATPNNHAARHAAAGSDPVTLAESQVTGLTAALELKAPLVSPALTGTVTVPTPAAGSETTVAASTAWAAERAKVGNLLTANQASGTDTLGDTTGFYAFACTLSSSTDWAAQGAKSLKVVTTVANPSTTYTALGSGTFNAPGLFGFVAGQVYTFRSVVQSALTNTMQMSVRWFNASNVYMSSSNTAATAMTTTGITLEVTAVPPTGAVSASVLWYIGGTWSIGATFYIDAIGVWAGAGGEWAMPGTPIANLGTKVSHPNADDVLVRRWDSSKATPGWQTVHYDSGVRDMAASLNTTVWSAALGLYLRRTGNRVRLFGRVTAGAAWHTTSLLTANLPVGFRPVAFAPFTVCRTQTGGSTVAGAAVQCDTGGNVTFLRMLAEAAGNADASGTIVWFDVAWETNDAIPTSLPGTLYAAAPA